jgi:hypothetical protein
VSQKRSSLPNEGDEDGYLNVVIWLSKFEKLVTWPQMHGSAICLGRQLQIFLLTFSFLAVVSRHKTHNNKTSPPLQQEEDTKTENVGSVCTLRMIMRSLNLRLLVRGSCSGAIVCAKRTYSMRRLSGDGLRGLGIRGLGPWSGERFQRFSSVVPDLNLNDFHGLADSTLESILDKLIVVEESLDDVDISYAVPTLSLLFLFLTCHDCSKES